jgi:hypothetical protein
VHHIKWSTKYLYSFWVVRNLFAPMKPFLETQNWCISYAKDGANWAEIWAETKTYRSDQRSNHKELFRSNHRSLIVDRSGDRIGKWARSVQPCIGGWSTYCELKGAFDHEKGALQIYIIIIIIIVTLGLSDSDCY